MSTPDPSSENNRSSTALGRKLLAQDHPGIRVPPPLIFLISFLAGCAIDSPWLSGERTGLVEIVFGGAVVMIGLWPIVWAFKLQRDAGTEVEPWRPTTAIVQTGPYRVTRNPMYLGMAVASVGLAVIAGSMAALATLVLCVVIIDRTVIRREEAYLEAKFGATYLDYKARVRRWV